MWFKNLQIYRFTRPFEHTIEALENTLTDFEFAPCGSQDVSKFGWVKPLGKFGQTLTHGADGNILLCVKKEEKMLPGPVIKDMVEERALALEETQGRALKKKEKDALKEDIIMELLPRAFSRTSQTFAWISPKSDLLVVDASSAKKAEELIALLRKCLGSLPVVPLSLTTPPELTMTDWLNEGNIPAGFNIEDEAELRSALEHGGIIRCKQQDLTAEEIKAHLDADKLVTKLALNWQENVSFILGEDMGVKRVKFSDVLREENEDVDGDDFAARFDADFALMTGELEAFIPALVEALGGEDKKA
ncbi:MULTISPECIES: recombination-associated protein RdgC [Motilimonas]|uniref:Recombination-associated protein RdgC n=1 Tax=Motilimonas cestriensis TaxID=2742685 RepID=A0ABS8W9K1_9GAMM|nr:MULTISPECIES: recombination-associated protein RdgC [Motilimonas]MCE2594393.1 recombination-associated protein RdgC [Motilimonas cestriensis]MDO6528138.1 recombination-associated protein RdgC [Motilimonas sp. 1_MG-2023]